MSTYTPVASQTLSASASSVTFSSIPQNYTDLVVVCNAITNTVANYELTFNSDSGTNYSRTYLLGNGSAASSGRASSANFIRCDQGGNLDTTWGNPITVNVMSYSNSTTYKSVLSRSGGASSGVGAVVGLWRNTAAITSLSFACSGATFSSGSTFSLYGIQAGTPKAQGGQIVTTDGTYWYHAFTGSGTFTPSTALTADIMLVAGGGGGGGNGGGGGAGGLLAYTSQSLSASTPYSCLVGAGGAAGSWSNPQKDGANGQDSVFGTLSAAIGGGRGGTYDSTKNGASGGSGGGGGQAGATPTGTGGGGTSGQGNNGANASGTVNNYAGGGGGAGAAATNQNGGAGSSTYSSWGLATNTGQNVSGTVYYAGGGGGGEVTSSNAGTGGNGGGGSAVNDQSGNAGTANTGGGGSGGSHPSNYGSNGGSGVIIIRYAV
jgi:hypothetical protein